MEKECFDQLDLGYVFFFVGGEGDEGDVNKFYQSFKRKKIQS